MHDLTLVFDLDGTLIDTAPDLILATNHILARLDLAPVPDVIMRPVISFGALAMIKKALKTHNFTLSEPEILSLWDEFLEFYAENIARKSRPFPGMTAALDHFRGEGTKLAICTNKREDLTLKLLEALDLKHYFTAIAGRDTFSVHKPDPAHLTKTIELARGSADRAIMVGDSQTDISTADAAGIPVIGVTFGYSDPPMSELNPAVIISSYAQFIEAVGTILNDR